MNIPPNKTIYINNLNEKIKMEELKKSLYHVFSQFGNILEINCSKTLKLRGQAWVIFDDLSASTKALREMANFNFYGKPMRVSYAKVKSDVISKMDGTFVPRPKRKETKRAPRRKAPKRAAVAAQAATVTPSYATNMVTEGPTPPHRILFVENLPPQCNAMMLAMLFQQYNGYQEVRLVDNKPGIAFVEFEDAGQASRAKDSLQDFKITPTNLMRITFAKK